MQDVPWTKVGIVFEYVGFDDFMNILEVCSIHRHFVPYHSVPSWISLGQDDRGRSMGRVVDLVGFDGVLK